MTMLHRNWLASQLYKQSIHNNEARYVTPNELNFLPLLRQIEGPRSRLCGKSIAEFFTIDLYQTSVIIVLELMI